MNIMLMISKNDKYGAQRIFLDQARVLDEMGHKVVVVARGDSGFVADSVRAMKLDYHGIPMKGIKDIFFLLKLVRKYNIHVIHTTLDRADYFGIILSRLTGVPVVSTMMVPRYHVGFRFMHRVVALSNKQRDLLIEKGIRPEKISVIRPGIDVHRFANPDPERREAWRQRLRTDDYSPIFCHISSLIPRKAHDVSIELVAECKKRGTKPLLIIIGDPLQGEYYDSLVRIIREKDLEQNVVFTGWTPDVPEILSLSHFTVLPSEGEALGVVLMEGMAAGTPIIARKGEGGAELIEEYGTGFLYNPHEGFNHLVEKIVSNHQDSVRYRSYARMCRNIAANEFNFSKFGSMLVKMYQTVNKR